MHVDIDKYAKLKSIIHNWDARFKIVCLSILILSFTLIQKKLLFPVMIIIPLVLAFIAKLPIFFILVRLRLAITFFIIVLIFLPLGYGDSVMCYIIGINIYYDGFYLALAIISRGIAIIITVIVMFGTAPFDISMRALYSLRMPATLISLILFTYRYIFLYMDNLRKMNNALILRGFKKKLRLNSIKIISILASTLLIRSYEQAERIYNAMILRGYQGRLLLKHPFRVSISDLVLAFIIVNIAVLLVYLEVGYVL